MIHRSHQAFVFEPKGIEIAGLPEAVYVGYNIWTPRHPHELGGHTHADLWEVHYVIHGQILEEIAGRTHVMTSGDVLIAPPGVVHTGINHVRHRCGVCWLGLRLPTRAALPGLTKAQTHYIRQRFLAHDGRPFPGDPALIPAFSALLHEASKSGQMQVLVCRALLHVILALLTRPRTSSDIALRARSPEVAIAVSMLSERLSFPMRIASLFPAVGLRRSALTKRFIAEMGISPLAFRTQMRLEEAKKQLLSASNSEIARRFGFSSPQHFVTLFRRAFGATPGVFRKQLLTQKGRDSQE
jgi:AraC-like DNA-binding protein